MRAAQLITESYFVTTLPVEMVRHCGSTRKKKSNMTWALHPTSDVGSWQPCFFLPDPGPLARPKWTKCGT